MRVVAAFEKSPVLFSPKGVIVLQNSALAVVSLLPSFEGGY